MFNTRERKERALGVRLGLKPYRSDSPKGALTRRQSRPGVHGAKRRRQMSEYGKQLQEKQKIRYTYGIRERQMVNIFKEATKSQGVTGEVIIELLERRLDNAVYRSGLAPSRSVARQLINHGHILVNGRKMTIPSYRVSVDDTMSIRPESRAHKGLTELGDHLQKYDAPVWLKVDADKLAAAVVNNPKDYEVPFDVGLVVDYYSK